MSTGKRPAFTLVELLVVIAIIGILIAMLLPAVQAAREAARRSQCSNNFKQVALGLHNYNDSHGMFAPGSFTWRANDCPPATPGSRGTWQYGWGWATFILPYIEMSTVYDQFDFTENSYNAPISYRAAGALITAYLCPSDPQSGEYMNMTGATGPDGLSNQTDGTDFMITNIAGVTHTQKWACTYFPLPFKDANGMMADREGCRVRDILDGTSNTLMLAEITNAGSGTNVGKTWIIFTQLDTLTGINGPLTIQGGYDPALYQSQQQWRWAGPSSFHPGGCNFALADGSVRFLSETTDLPTLWAITTRAGNEPVEMP